MKLIITEGQYRILSESKLREATYTPKARKNDPAMMTWDEYFEFNNPLEMVGVKMLPRTWTQDNDWNLYPDDSYPTTTGGKKLDYFADSKTTKTYVRNDAPQDIIAQAKQVPDVQLVDNIIPLLKHRLIGPNPRHKEDPKGHQKIGQQVFRTVRGLQFKMKLGLPKTPLNTAVYLWVENDGIMVGSTEVLMSTTAAITRIMADYAGYGIGKWLAVTARRIFEHTRSGGQSDAGFLMLKKIHKQAVKQFIAGGVYSQMIRDGMLTKDKVKEIIDSAKAEVDVEHYY